MSNYRTRAVLIIVVIAGGSAAAASVVGWQTWKPISACLLCDGANSDSAASQDSAAAGSVANRGAAYRASSTATAGAGALAPVPFGAGDVASAPMARFGSAPKGWQPWGASSGIRSGGSSSVSAPSVALGGLWRLMSLSRPASPATDHAVVAKAGHAPKPPASPKPPKPRHSGSPAAPASPSTSTIPVDATVASVTDTFHEHDTPTPDPFGGPSGGSGFDPGGTGLHLRAGGAGSVSATPEPGSLVLLGTGLFGSLAMLRRRRFV